MRYGRSGDLGQRLPDIFRLLTEIGETRTPLEFMSVVLNYVTQAGGTVTETEFARALKALPAEERDEIMPTLAEQWMEEGRQEGLQQGLRQARAAMLASIEIALDLKFGSESTAAMEEIRAIDDLDRLNAVPAAIRDATTVDELRRRIQSE